MISEAFLQHLGIILVGATMMLLLARMIRLPAIVAYLLAGIVIGPLTGWVVVTDATGLITETGIVLLLFLVGLELTFEKIREVGKVALIVGAAQVALCVVGGAAVSFLLGMRGGSLWIFGFALAFSSTVVAVKMLVSRGESHTVFGKIAVGVLLVQDVVVVLLLTVIAALGEDSGGGSAALAGKIAMALGGMIFLLVAVLAVARFLLVRPFAWASRSPETLFILSLCWCFVVVMATHWLHLSHEIGAFIAGVSLAQLPYNHDLQRRVQPLINFFVAVFFVTLGVGLHFQAEAVFWLKAILLSIFVLVGKLIIITAIVRRLRYDRRTAFFSALMLSQISEFSFILAGVASRAGLLESSASSLLGVIGLITIAVSAMAMIHKETLFRRFIQKASDDTSEVEEQSASRLKDHVVVVGANTLGRELTNRLCARGETVVTIDIDPGKLAGLPCTTLLGDASMLPVLEEAGYRNAKLLVSTLHIAPVNDLLAYRCKLAGTMSSVHAFDLKGVDNLLEMDVSYLIVPKVDGIKRQNHLLEEMEILSKA